MSRAAPKPAPTTEAKRLAELQRYSILGTPAEDAFDRLAGLARSVAQSKGALLSFLGETRVYHKAQVGLQPHSYPRTQTLCSYAATHGKPLVLADAQAAPEVADLAFVKQNSVRFYLSVPLVTENGVALGSLSVFDSAPRGHAQKS